MFGELESPWILIMIIGMFIWLLITFFIQKRTGSKEHRYDKRYQYQRDKAKARSWDTMLVVMTISIPALYFHYKES